MPLENLEEEGLEKNPNLELAQTKFLLSLSEHKNDTFLKTKLLDAIKAESEIAHFFLVTHFFPEYFGIIRECTLISLDITNFTFPFIFTFERVICHCTKHNLETCYYLSSSYDYV